MKVRGMTLAPSACPPPEKGNTTMPDEKLAATTLTDEVDLITYALELAQNKSAKHQEQARFLKEVMVPYVRYLQEQQQRHHMMSADDFMDSRRIIAMGAGSMIVSSLPINMPPALARDIAEGLFEDAREALLAALKDRANVKVGE
jgi:hypothetical protein